MEMHPIKGSSRFTAYGFEPNTPSGSGYGMLALEFSHGETWWYRSVPSHVLENFLMSDSKGAFFGKYIKDKYIGKPAEVPPWEDQS